MHDPTEDQEMVEIELGRLVLRDHSFAAPQYIYLREVGGERSFPIVIGYPEAAEIQRLVTGDATERPMTHQLMYNAMRALGAQLARVDIIEIRHNTFFAQLVLADENGEPVAIIDSRPSDSIALALRAKCPLRVAESVLEQVRTDDATDPLGGKPDEPGEPGEPGPEEPPPTPETPGF